MYALAFGRQVRGRCRGHCGSGRNRLPQPDGDGDRRSTAAACMRGRGVNGSVTGATGRHRGPTGPGRQQLQVAAYRLPAWQYRCRTPPLASAPSSPRPTTRAPRALAPPLVVTAPSGTAARHRDHCRNLIAAIPPPQAERPRASLTVVPFARIRKIHRATPPCHGYRPDGRSAVYSKSGPVDPDHHRISCRAVPVRETRGRAVVTIRQTSISMPFSLLGRP